ncbi:hypothetical protein SAMN04487898_10383 [Pedobacter sp. ok626]|uniref:hypothetical protein n=1 Tax=Pedobacter sp. ok626 TaxID=1761882 RepID=UPI00088D3965|nr:hypothetical protein [Pedobacter sp. ok626]SDJ49525.1 hypothetical protein SAMN04487898_10383 [Pedobacter sp. ok626]
MKLLPYDNIEIFSPLSPAEAQSALEQEVKKRKPFSFKFISSGSDPYFYGFVENNRFRLHRNINYRNSFLPTINGSITNDLNGCKVVVKMRLMAFVLVFITLWLSGVFFACIFLTSKLIIEGNYGPEMLIPFGMLIMGYGLTMGAFHYEARKAKAKLLELFKGTTKRAY